MSKACISLIVSFIAAWVGLANFYPTMMTPTSANGLFDRIHGDGWIVDGSRIQLIGLASRGNRLALKFNPWRPAGAPPAIIQITVCGDARGEYAITGSEEIVVGLAGRCEPREIAFKVMNPVRASATDERELGAQLVHARVFSRGGMLIPAFLTLGFFTALFAVASFCSWISFGGVLGALIALLLPAAGALLVADDEFPMLHNSTYLWGFLASLFAGLAAARAAGLEGAREALRSKFFHMREEQGGDDVESRTNWLILLVVLFGTCLRFYGIGFGLPSNFHPDEVPKVNAIMRMVASGTLDPDYFLHPSLLLYSTYLMNTLFHWVGMSGEFRDTAFLAGRTVSAIAGSLSIYFVYVVGARLYSRVVGVSAAALFAVFPLHVTCSRYLKEDALLVALILWTTVIVLKSVYEERPALLMWAGFFAGVTSSAKYSGMLSALVVAGAPWLASRSWKPSMRFFIPGVVGAFLMPLGFVLCSPYTLLNSAKFFKDFASEQHHMSRGHTTSIDAWSQYWMYHFSRSIVPGMHTFAAFAAIAAAGVLAWRRRVEDLAVLALIILFYLPAEWVKAKPAPQPERYILPCLPFLAVALAELVRVLGTSLKTRPLVLAGFLALWAFPAWDSIRHASEITHDTRDRLADWMRTNLPPGSKVLLDWKPYAPRFFHNEFEIAYVPRATILEKLSVRALKNSGYDYIVLSSLFYDRYFSQPSEAAHIRARFREVFQRVPVVTQIAPEHGTYGFHNPVLTLFSLKHDDFVALDHELMARKAGTLMQTTNEVRAKLEFDQKTGLR